MHSPIFSKEIFVAKIWLCCVFAALLVLSVNCSAQASHEAKKAAKDPARITDALREETPNDFLRVTFVSAGTSVTSLARPGALRAFATATAFYLPPLPLKEFPLYSGLVNDDTKTLVALPLNLVKRNQLAVNFRFAMDVQESSFPKGAQNTL